MITREQLQEAAQGAHNALPPGHGFILIVAPTNESGETVEGQYASNLNREDSIAILKTVLFRWGHNDEWMKSIK